MERFKFEEPTINRKDEAIAFINEFYDYNSNTNGTGGLDKYSGNYSLWLEKLENAKNGEKTYFFIRTVDNKIVGMASIRLKLNEGGNIDFSIRPTERNKGYNKINLYLALIECKRFGLDEVLLDADIRNPASWRSMEALGGERVLEQSADEVHQVKYKINVKNALIKHMSTYLPLIGEEYEKRIIY